MLTNWKKNAFLLSALCLSSGTAISTFADIQNHYVVVYKSESLEKGAGGADATAESVQEKTNRIMNEIASLSITKGAGNTESSSIENEVTNVYEFALEGFSAELTPEAVEYLANHADVEYVAADVGGSGHEVQDNPIQWGLDRIDQRNLPLDLRYEFNGDGTGVHAYVLDSGIRFTHQEFIGRIGNGFDFQDNDADPTDCHGHGNHVSGILGGTTYGVAKDVTIHPVRVLDCNNRFDTATIVINAIEWVIQNAQRPAVVNMSLSTGVPFTPLDTATENLINAGITTVVSAGNGNQDACTDGSPIRVPNAITVGSTTRTDARSSFSNFGTCLDIFAPGSSIISAFWTGDTATTTFSGTSMAAPHVAGTAAIYLEANPNATVAEVTNAILAQATSGIVTNPGPDSVNLMLYSKDIVDPSVQPANVTIEAETGSTFGGAQIYNDGAASGGQGIAFISTLGAGFSLTNVPASDSIRIAFASELSGMISLSVNGSDAGNLSFSSTGSWVNNYSTVTLNIDIPENATFEIFFDNGDTAMNVDSVTFVNSTAGATPTPEPTPSVTPTATPTTTPTATPTPLVTPTATPMPTAIPTAIPTPIVTPTTAPTAAPTPTSTPTTIPTPTPTLTPMPEPTPTSAPAGRGAFGIESLGGSNGIVYHEDNGWTASFVYLCINDDCRVPILNNGFYVRQMGNFVEGDSYKLEFKVQDNQVGQCLSGTPVVTFQQSGAIAPSNCD